MMSPTFTVIIPTHNRAHLLPRAIRSVLAQTFTDFELIVVDDASTDDTAHVVSSFQDERLRYVRRERNGGNAAARNTGVQMANGQFISFLDDDDEFLEQFLERTHCFLAASPSNVGFSWCGVRVVGEGGSVRESIWHPSYPSRENAYLSFLQSRRVGIGCGITLRRSCFDSVGMFDEELRTAVDTDFLIRLVREYDFVVVPEILICVHMHDGPSVHKNTQHRAYAYERIMQKHLGTLQRHPHLWARMLYKTAWLHYHGGNRAQGRRYMAQALRLRPFWPRLWALWPLLEVLGPWGPAVHRAASRLKNRLPIVSR